MKKETWSLIGFIMVMCSAMFLYVTEPRVAIPLFLIWVGQGIIRTANEDKKEPL